MAVSPLLEQEDSQKIIKLLLISNRTIPKLLDSPEIKNAPISTATIYRRVKELYLAGYLDKLEDGSYKTSEKGKIAYNELFENKTYSNELQKNLSNLVKHISQKESYVLYKIQKKSSYTSGLLQEISISPNDLLKIFENLIKLQLIEVVEKPGKKPGRPKKMYKISQTGILLIQEIEKLKEKIRETR